VKLALIIDANPKYFRALGNRIRLRQGKWVIRSEGMVDSIIAIYHAPISMDKATKQESYGNFDKHMIEKDSELVLSGPAYCYVEFLKQGNEKSISMYALS
jgi:hypothetical protein